MKEILKRIFKTLGYQIKKYQDEDMPRLKIIKELGINKLLDVGANAGQYSLKMRKLGFKKKIISFEPLKSAFEKLQKAASKDKNWIVNNYALGNEDAENTINVSRNSYSSSILNMLPEHMDRAPESTYVAKESIRIKKLDSIFLK